jgi:hypothetical protein
MTDKRTFDIRDALIQKQTTLLAGHDSLRGMTGHGTTLGDKDEKHWSDILRGFLPERYEVGPVFAVDHLGNESQQIDIAIYDRHFSPLWFGEQDETRFVPVESIYAVFEAKPELDKTYLGYACEKVASVRNLQRTSTPIAHAGGTFQAVNLGDRPILGGVLAAKSGWTTVEGTMAGLTKYLPPLGQPDSLNIGIALDTLAFDFTPNKQVGAPTQTVNTAALAFHTSNQLIRFAARLFRLLQSIGSVPAIDMAVYEQALD